MTQCEYFDKIDNGYASLRPAELETLLLRLEKQSSDEYGAASAMHASVLGELGAFYRGQALYEKSEAAFSAALDILGAVSVGADYATALNNLAGTHRLIGRLDEAEAEFSECMRIYRRTIGEGHVLYASALNNLSLVFLDRGDTDRAIELQSRAAAILSANPGARDEYASFLCNTGALLCRIGRLDEAKARLVEAIGLFENELGTDTPHYHAALNTLGTAHYRAGEFDMALEMFLRAAQAAQELYGPEHRECELARRHAELAREALQGANGKA